MDPNPRLRNQPFFDEGRAKTSTYFVKEIFSNILEYILF